MSLNETTTSLPIEVLGGIISLGRWLEAIGIILIGWIILNIVNFIINRRRLKEILALQKSVHEIGKKITRIEKHIIKKK